MSSTVATPRTLVAPVPRRAFFRAEPPEAIDPYTLAALGWPPASGAPHGHGHGGTALDAGREPRRRGLFLTLWLGLMALGVGWGTATTLDPLVAGSFTLPGALSAILGGVALAGLAGLWAWRGWGLHAVWGAAMATLTVNLLGGAPVHLALLGLAGPLVLTVAASGRAHLFD